MSTFTIITLTGQFAGATGGLLYAQLSSTMTNAALGTIQAGTTYQAPIGADGTVSLPLPANDDPGSTPGTAWRVTGMLAPSGRYTATVQLLRAGGGVQNLATLDPAAGTTPYLSYIPLPQRGTANGVATLGSDGLVPAGQLPAGGGGGALPVLRGAWSNSTAYAVNDGVTYSGSSYYALNAHTNSPPPSANWQLYAAAGAPGAAGATGPAGTPGAAGTAGATGAAGTAGTTGPTGTAGATGGAGPTGSTGATGAAGSNGTAGATGTTGAAGTNGTAGATGTPGTNGATGPNPLYGLLSARPAAGTAGDKALYAATDVAGGTLYQVQGGAWVALAPGVSGGGADARITGTGSLALGAFAGTLPGTGTLMTREATETLSGTKTFSAAPHAPRYVGVSGATTWLSSDGSASGVYVTDVFNPQCGANHAFGVTNNLGEGPTLQARGSRSSRPAAVIQPILQGGYSLPTNVAAAGDGAAVDFLLPSSNTTERRAGWVAAVIDNVTEATYASHLEAAVIRGGAIDPVAVWQADGTSSATQTGMLLWYNGTLSRVLVGAADSAGTGFRTLRIAN